MFWSLFFQLFALTCAFFDVDEINNVKYGIDILDSPVTAEEGSDAGKVLLASKFGQQYQCSFAEREQDVDLNEKRREQEALEKGIVELLKPIKDRDCLTLTKGWWTYELCYAEHIRQYHVEDGVAQNINYLGFYESDLDWSSVTEEKVKPAKERYHSQEYVNGTICDLTGKPRKAQVRYYCEPDIGDYLLAVDEFETCVYTLFVHTERICQHPYLKPARRAKAVPITCHPLLTEEEYREYTEMTTQEDKPAVPESSTEEAAAKFDSWQDYNVDTAVDTLQKLITQSLTAGLGDTLGVDDKGKKIRVRKLKTMKLKKKDIASAIEEIVSKTKDEDSEGDEEGDEEDAGDGDVDYKMDDDGSEMTRPDGEDDKDDGAIDLGGDDDDVDDRDDDDDDVDERALLKEFDKGLDELAKSGRYLNEIKQYKEEIQKEMSSQFTEIIREAEEELNAAGFKDQVDRDSVLKTMSETLEKLLKKLEEKQATGHRKEISSMIDKAASVAMETLKSDSPKDGSDKLQLDDGDAGDGEVMKMNAVDDDAAAVDDNDDEMDEDKEEVMTITKEPHDTKQSSSEDVESSAEPHDEDEEDALSLEYEIKYGGQTIQVKIFTADDYMNIDEESSPFHANGALNRMLVAVLGANTDELEEAKRQEKLNSNYGFVWKKEKSKKKFIPKSDNH